MKKMKLINLNLKEFKGKTYSLQANGTNLNIDGPNASGKTTIFDGFTWLLFGRDSLNRGEFDIKTLDENGKVAQPGIEHEVEGKFEVDGKPLILRRVHKENWVKEKGQAEKVFSGNVNKFFVDEEPVQKKVYDERVKEIISEDAFKLLTSPTYFNEQLSKKKRRETLIQLVDEVKDEEIISRNKDLETFVEKLEGREVESFQNIISAKRKKLNDELDKIPIRIDEVHLSMPDIKGLKKEKIEINIENINKKMKDFQEKINDIRSGTEINNKRKELSDIELELTNIVNNHDKKSINEKYRLESKEQAILADINMKRVNIHNQEKMIANNMHRVDTLEDEVQELRERYSSAYAIEFSHDSETSCPACEQDLPEEQINEAHRKAQENFNEDKSKNLERITEEAKKKKEDINSLNNESERIKKNNQEIEDDIKQKEIELESLKHSIKDVKQRATDVTESTEYQNIIEKKSVILDEISTLEGSINESIKTTTTKIDELEEAKTKEQEDMNMITSAETSKTRLNELEDEERNLAMQVAELDKQIFQSEEYTKIKLRLIEDKINDKFEYATFRLFKPLIKGGYDEVCDTLYEGVPYDSGLNNASKINVGLDIINTLSNHYGYNVPIFIDNAESIIEMAEINSQVISLRVKDVEDLEVQEIEKTA